MRKIRTPWRQQWRRIRYQLLPVVTMVTCSVAVGVLWHRQYGGTDALGHIEEVRAAAMTAQAGTLMPLARKPWSLYDQVLEDEVIARLDDRPVLGRLEMVQAELDQLRAQLTTALKAGSPAGAAEGASARVDIEESRLECLRQTALALQNRVELQRQGGGAVDGALGAAVRAVVESGDEAARAEALAAKEAAEVRLRHLLERRDAIGRAIDAAQARMASPRAATEGAPLSDALAGLLAGIHAQAQVQEANLRGIELEIDGLEIRSPVTGKIVMILRHPGQSVQPGNEVMIVAREQSDSAIAYLRSDQRIRPEMDMRVYVWPRGGRSRPVEARVAGVGPQMQEIPELIARSQKVREWGLPVLVRLPPGYRARPGEVVNIRFPHGEEGP